MSDLALLGGNKVRQDVFPAYRVIGAEEEDAVIKVLRSGVLSKFLGVYHKDFYGGPVVRALEEEWADYFEIKHAIAVNSATSGLYCAVAAANIGPGDEVIVSPYTMSASAAAVLAWNAIPVFADIEEDYYCLNPVSVEQCITTRTKAIIAVDIFGQPYNADAINAIAKKHDLLVIEDAAQAPGAKYKGKWAGTLGDMGVYSLNYHKHIHAGEGGIVVTNDDELATRVRLVRNHAEAVVEDMGYHNLVNMLGFNYRMTEIEAAIAREQLKKLAGLIYARRLNVECLNEKLTAVSCIDVPKVRPECEHSWYVHPLQYKKSIGEINRELYVQAVAAELMPTELRESEGVNIGSGYVKPLYLQPIYQERIAYGYLGCPFTCPHYQGTLNYAKGICPICEKMHYEVLITNELIRPPLTASDLEHVAEAFKKVYDNRHDLLAR